MKICIDIQDNEINPALIQKLINSHRMIERLRLQKLENYYIGKQDILDRVVPEDKPNNKSVTNYCSYITDSLVGFFMGSPVIYNSTDKQYLALIKDIFNSNDEQELNIELARKQSIKGKGFELLYIDEDSNIRFDVLDTDEVIMVYDTTIESVPSMAIRYYTIYDFLNDTEILKAEVYTKDKIFYYTGNELTLVNTADHYFKEVPIIEYYNNIYRLGDFEKIIALQDNYNLTNADVSNELSYFADCYLKLKGMSGTTDEDIAEMKNNRVLLLEDNAEADFMTKTLSDTVIQNHRSNIKEDIHKISYVPDLSQELPANLSGSAIKQKFFNTEQLVIAKERKFSRALKTRIRLITNILNLKNGSDFNWKDIEIKFIRNLPINYTEMADSATKLNGILSKRSLITLVAGLVGIEDVDAELAEIEKEQNANVDLNNLHTDEGV